MNKKEGISLNKSWICVYGIDTNDRVFSQFGAFLQCVSKVNVFAFVYRTVA